VTVDAVLSWQLHAFAVVVLSAFLGWVLYLVRYHRLSLRDSLLWLLSTASALAVAMFPGVLTRVARAIGVTVPSNALFAFAFVYVLLNLLAATVAISGNAARLRRLTQECALLRAELDALRRRDDPSAGERGTPAAR
jgi:hypothetical protein